MNKAVPRHRALAADLLQQEESTLSPDGQREPAFAPRPDTQIVAAFAVFRNLDSASIPPRMKKPSAIGPAGNRFTLAASHSSKARIPRR